jgi:hypothetical protein
MLTAPPTAVRARGIPTATDPGLREGIKHTDLLAVPQRCHPETLRQMRWANGKLDESATQALVS